MTLSVKSGIVKDKEGRIKYWLPRDTSREHYNIAIWLDGDESELNGITKAEYLLDQSFKNNRRISHNRDDRFRIAIWTYGYFPIDVTVTRNDGETRMIKYYLIFDLPADEGNNYIRTD